MKVRDMRLRRHGVVAIAVLGLMATAVVPASAERGGGGLGGAAKAAAFALDVDVDVLGALPLDVGPLARLRLSGDAGPRYANVLKVEVPPLLEALVLATGAQTKVAKDVYSKASARVATIKLQLLGDLLIKLVKSECEVSSDTVNVASDIVFADGSVLGGLVGADMLALAARPNSRISIPLVGDLILNEQKIEKTQSAKGNQVDRDRQRPPPGPRRHPRQGRRDRLPVGVPGQRQGRGQGPEGRVHHQRQRHQRPARDDDGETDGLLDGVLGDGSLLGVNNLLGGGLLNGGL